MPRIPDETAFGASPTPQSSNYVPQDSGYENAPAQAMKRLGATLEDASQTVERVQDTKDRYAAEDAYNQLLSESTTAKIL